MLIMLETKLLTWSRQIIDFTINIYPPLIISSLFALTKRQKAERRERELNSIVIDIHNKLHACICLHTQYKKSIQEQ